ADDPDAATRVEFLRELARCPFTIVAAELDRPDSVASLRSAIYDSLGVIRVYTKKPGKPADYAAPYSIPKRGTVEDLALKVHQHFASSLKFARIWAPDGTGGQTVGRDHVLND